MNTRTAELAGLNCIVTRYGDAGRQLCNMIEQHGGTAWHVPTIEIVPLPVRQPSQPQLPAQADIVFFASRAAVMHGLPALQPELLRNAKVIAAIGKTTAAALAEHGITPVLTPDPAAQESEGLLALPEFTNLDGKTVLVVRGRQGRGLLVEQMTARGAFVNIFECYRREPLPLDRKRFGQMTAKLPLAIIFASNSEANALAGWLQAEDMALPGETILVAPTSRMLKLADTFTLQHAPWIAGNAANPALLETLLDRWPSQRQEST